MSTFTKEQLIARINQVTAINKYRISRDPDADGLAMDNELFAIALASLEAEAVCVIDQSNLDYLKSGSDADVWPASRTEMGDVLLYRTAPPAPVSVPTFEEWCELTERKPVGWVRDAMKEAYDGCRAAMLQGADGNSPVIPDGWKLVPVIAFPSQWAAGQKAFNSAGINKVDAVYKAMIEAAPQQEAQ